MIMFIICDWEIDSPPTFFWESMASKRVNVANSEE